jgi:hypothetical protein
MEGCRDQFLCDSPLRDVAHFWHCRCQERLNDQVAEGLVSAANDITDPRTKAPPYIRCAGCGRISYHPTDIAENYCGACHDWFTDRPNQ